MLTAEGLVKSFAGNAAPAVNGVGFEVTRNSCYALLGPSGCGKTTTLRCIAGLEHPSSGRIAIGTEVVCDAAHGILLPAHRRSIGMVFQSYAVWPHLDVFENVAYPLRVARPRIARSEILERTTAALQLVGMDLLAQRPTSTLSGGEQQRVALARAIVRRPALLLLDEPLASLDVRLRERMRDELRSMIERAGITTLYVTHDQSEAFVMADRIAVMSAGEIVQEGTPRELYERPRSRLVADFLGTANLLTGHVETQRSGKATVAVAGERILVATDCAPDQRVEILVRPEHIELSSARPASMENVLRGRIAHMHFLGSHCECGVALGDLTLTALARPSAEIFEGAPVWLRIDTSQCVVFPGATRPVDAPPLPRARATELEWATAAARPRTVGL
jgi:iron(III) transport system ATP-binding protein